MGNIYVGSKVILSKEELGGEVKDVNAAGGLVHNAKGQYLMIRRNDIWDLPKGHQEKGEEISRTALREVFEETGLDNLQLEDFICETRHCYRRDGVWVLKHTFWYNMACTQDTALVPQTEENITEAVWMDRDRLEEALKDTFPSILEVFAKVL